MSKYNPTVYVDYQTPINAENLNKSENATSQQGSDIEVLSDGISLIYNDMQIISDEVVNLTENKSDKNHTHDEIKGASYFLYKEVHKFISMI